VIVGGPIFPCCCDDDFQPPCAGLAHGNAPDTINVSLSYVLDWVSNVWLINEEWDVDVRATSGAPCVNAGYAEQTFPYARCGPQAPAPDSFICAQDEYLACPRVEAAIDATYQASLSIQASGQIGKTSTGSWAGSTAVLYRGQIPFEYDFASDFPDTSPAAGEFEPTTNAWPLSGGQTSDALTTGLRVELICVKSATAFARGMCKPFYPQHPQGVQAEELLFSGPHLLLRAQIVPLGLGNSNPYQAPPVDDGGPLALRRFADGVNDFAAGSQGAQGWSKLQPWTTVWAKQGLPLQGSYQMARGSVSNTSIWPITRSDRACELRAGSCDPNPYPQWRNSACTLDPDRGPLLEAQLACVDSVGGQFFEVPPYTDGNLTYQCPHNPHPCGILGNTVFRGTRTVAPQSGTEINCYTDRVGQVWRWLNNRGVFSTRNASVG
jgi:hypothetical protein